MTLEDHVSALFSEANPVPDPSTLVMEPATLARLEDIEHWGATMETTELRSVEPTPPGGNRRAWLVGGVAAAVVLIAGLAAGLLLTGGDEAAPVTVPTTQPATTTEPPTTTATTVAEARPTEPAAVIEYLYRVWLDDPRAAAAVFADDAVINNSPVQPFIREGIGPIRTFLASQANILVTNEITRIEVDGDTVSWDVHVITTDGRDIASTGHVAVVEDGKIVTWDFGSL